MSPPISPGTIVDFWRKAGPEKWFAKDPAFDETIRDLFLPAYEAAARGERGDWELIPDGALALLLLLDQFPRNMFRGQPETYKTDPAALMVAERAIEKGFDHRVDPSLRRFFYLPFMHSEELRHQERSVALNEGLGQPDVVKWARHHHAIIAHFGRFPHRNALLGRVSTSDEERFLAEDDFRG